jgi:hypothetical protein
MSTETLHTEPSYPAKAGYPVRRSFSIHHQRSGILDHPLSRMMTAGCVVCSHSSNMHVSSRDALAPELCMFLRLEKQRAQGKPGARCTRSRACRVLHRNTRPSLREGDFGREIPIKTNRFRCLYPPLCLDPRSPYDRQKSPPTGRLGAQPTDLTAPRAAG